MISIKRVPPRSIELWTARSIVYKSLKINATRITGNGCENYTIEGVGLLRIGTIAAGGVALARSIHLPGLRHCPQVNVDAVLAAGERVLCEKAAGAGGARCQAVLDAAPASSKTRSRVQVTA